MQKSAVPQELAVQQAIEWEVRLREEGASAPTRAQFEAWCRADALNEAAWRRLQARLGQLSSLRDTSGHAVSRALNEPNRSRRNVLKIGTGVATLMLVGVGSRQLVRTFALDADYHNAGRVPVSLALGDVAVTLGSTARVYAGERQDGGMYLASGQVMVDGRDADKTFVTVSTRDGQIDTRGARLSVDILRQHTIVAVQGTDAVFHPRGSTPVQLAHGATWSIARGLVSRMPETPGDVFAWTKGTLVVQDRGVPDILETFGRYYRGYIRFPKAAFSRRVSGTFPLDDIDFALRQLADALGLSLKVYGRVLAVAA